MADRDMTYAEQDPPLAIDAQGLTRRYRHKTAVDDLSLQIAAGETFGILGTNGAGKTTTVEMIAGLRRPTEGTVRIHGLDPFADRARVRQILGVQLQQAYLHGSLTARELVDLYRSFYPDPLDADQALAMVELTEKAKTRFDDLSGGQMQRLSIALALIGRPQVVILDELTTGLDPRAAPGLGNHRFAGRADGDPGQPCHGRGRTALRPGRTARRRADHRPGHP